MLVFLLLFIDLNHICFCTQYKCAQAAKSISLKKKICYKKLICECIVTGAAAPALCANAGVVWQTLSSSVSSCPALFVVPQFTAEGPADCVIYE